MKNLRKSLIPIILLAALIGIGVAGCGSPESIVGKWQGVMEPDAYIEFFSDGRIELTAPDKSLTGTYEIEEGVQVEGAPDKINQLTIIITGMFEGPGGEYGISYSIYEIEGNILTITQQNSSSTWVRAD